MAWDPSVRPRAPRRRANNGHFVDAWLPIRARTILVSDAIAEDQLRKICAHFLPNRRPVAEILMRPMAGRYHRWRANSVVPRSFMRHELRMLAHLATKIIQNGPDRDEAKSALARAIWALEPSTKRLLIEEIARTEPDGSPALYKLYGPQGHSPRFVLRAALQAEARVPHRGDYSNVALKRAIAYFVLTWALLGDREVSVARRVLHQPTFGAFTTTTASACGRFILEFFRVVDPSLNVSTVANALAARFAYLNQQGLSHPEMHRLDVVKLLSGEELV